MKMRTATGLLVLALLACQSTAPSAADAPGFAPYPIAIGAGLPVDPVVTDALPVALYLRQDFEIEDATKLLEKNGQIIQTGTHAVFPVSISSPPAPTGRVANEQMLQVSTALLPRNSVFVLFPGNQRFERASATNSSRPDDPVRIDDRGLLQAVFTTGPCPHVTWIGGRSVDGGLKAWQVGVSEEIAVSELRPDRFTLSYGNQRLQPVRITSAVMAGERLGHYLEFEFDPPLPFHSGEFAFSLSRDIHAVSGAPFAGEFQKTLSCAPAGYGLSGVTLSEPSPDFVSYVPVDAVEYVGDPPTK